MFEEKKYTAEEVKEIRKRLGCTQQEFGERLGFTAGGASRSVLGIETGERPISGTVNELLAYIDKHGVISAMES